MKHERTHSSMQVNVLSDLKDTNEGYAREETEKAWAHACDAKRIKRRKRYNVVGMIVIYICIYKDIDNRNMQSTQVVRT